MSVGCPSPKGQGTYFDTIEMIGSANVFTVTVLRLAVIWPSLRIFPRVLG